MRKFVLVIMVLMMVMALPAIAQEEIPDFIQHSECEYDLTGETITIYHLGDISSPGYSPITLPLLAALSDATIYFNERGGVCGATLTQENIDTGGDPARTQAGYETFRDAGIDALLLYSSADSELLRPQLINDEIAALISAGSMEGLYGESGTAMDGWVYATNPLYTDQFADFCRFVGASPEMFPEPAIGYIGWGGPFAAFGLAAYTAETVSYCESQGVTVLNPAETFLPTADAVSISTQVENLYDAGANIIYVNALATGPVGVAEAIEFSGLSDELQLAAVNWGMDTSAALLSRATLGEDDLPVINNMIGSVPFYWWTETDVPGIALITEQADLNERDLPTRGIAYLLGWMTTDIYIEMYIQTVNRVGSLDAVTGADLKETMDSMVHEAMGLFEFNFNNGELRAAPNNRLMRFNFANATMDGIATSGDDAMKVPLGDGTNFYPPVLVPLTDFAPAPDMRPGMSE